MIWPDPTNSSMLEFLLFNPQGALVQQSYDDGTPGRVGRSPNIQHVEVNDPTPGRWTAGFLWGGIDDFVEIAPAAPGTYRGPMSFRVSGQDYITAPAIRPVTTRPLQRDGAAAGRDARPAGDHPESLQLSASNGRRTRCRSRAGH